MDEVRPSDVRTPGRVRRRAAWTLTAGASAVGLVALVLVLPGDRGSTPEPAAAGPRSAAVTDPPATAASGRPGTAAPGRTGAGGSSDTVAPGRAAPGRSSGTVAPGARLDPGQARRDAESALRSFLALSDRTYQTADGELAPGVADVAAGFALGEVRATAVELQGAGARQTGSVSVARLEVDSVDLTAAPPTVTVRACLDTANIDVLALDGSSTKQGRQGTFTRTLHVFGVQYAGAWRVTTHSFPDRADCPLSAGHPGT
jgi:hypothetical protein